MWSRNNQFAVAGGRLPILRTRQKISVPEVRLQLRPRRVRRKLAVVLFLFSQHKENRERECGKDICKQARQSSREGIELGPSKVYELVTSGEAGVQKSEGICFREGPDMC